MSNIAHKGDWVRIEQIILTPEQRLESLPESTRKVPLKCWTNGFLENETAFWKMRKPGWETRFRSGQISEGSSAAPYMNSGQNMTTASVASSPL